MLYFDNIISILTIMNRKNWNNLPKKELIFPPPLWQNFCFYRPLSTGDDFIHGSGIMIYLVQFLATREAVALLANDPIMMGRSIWTFTHLEHQNLSKFEPCSSSNGCDIFLISFLANKDLVAPLANYPIMSGRSIQWFKHLKHQNLSTGDDFIHSSGIFF